MNHVHSSSHIAVPYWETDLTVVECILQRSNWSSIFDHSGQKKFFKKNFFFIFSIFFEKLKKFEILEKKIFFKIFLKNLKKNGGGGTPPSSPRGPSMIG